MDSTSDASETQPRAVNKWSKFQLLMWKNWLLVKRLKVQTTLEIVIPVIFSALLVLIRGLSDPDVFPEPFDYNSLVVVNSTWERPGERDFDWAIAYSPQNPLLDKLMEDVQVAMNLTRIDPYRSASELNAHLVNEKNRPLVGIIFDESFSTATSELPKDLNYKMRFPGELRVVPTFQTGTGVLYNNWRTQFLYPPFAEGGPRNKFNPTGGRPPSYYSERWSHVQSAVSLAFIKAHLGNSGAWESPAMSLPEIFLQRFSYPPATVDILLEVLKVFVSLIFFLSFLYPCINNVKMITVEKERQLKESMKIMGLPSWLHWSAWFTKIMLFMTVSITLMVILLKIRWESDIAVFTYSNGFALWLFLFIYSISVTMFIFMMSVMFSKANTAATIAGLAWFLFSSPYNFTEPNYDSLSLATKMLTCLFHNSGMSYGFLLILSHEANLEGLQWNNFFTPVTVDDNFTVGHVTIMLMVASVLYLLITLYLEKIFPGDFGVPEKWNFPLQMLFNSNNRRYEVEDSTPAKSSQAAFIEAFPTGKKAGIQMRSLRKVYGNKKVAVEGLTLNMYDDEITVLLGDNGAGKTTTMSMLTGMFPPTSGTAIVNGCDIRNDIAGVRQSIGLCPQHNILFDDLTVREHIIFFSKLKGLTDEEAEMEVQKFVNILELQPKIEAQSKTLSGGMKRKLSVGVALCGGSKVVLCDEPTSGMDPAARRALWDLLQQEKKGRTIVLSTHFMDEADVLGDRIAIMHSGELKCYGSSFFLKNIFGSGYELIFEKGADCDVNGITRLMRKYIDDIKVDTNVGSELSYKLDARNSHMFKAMLRELEDRSASLGVDGYGISLTTLEEVFIKVTTDAPEVSQSNGLMTVTDSPRNSTHLEDVERATFVSLNNFEMEKGTLTGLPLVKNQIGAMLLKKTIYTKRNWILLLVQILIPVILAVITVLITKSFVISETLPALDITLESYSTIHPVALLSNQVANSDSPGGRFVSQYSKIMQDQSVSPRSLHSVPDVREYILNLTSKELVTFNNRYLIGVTVEDRNITTWFNNQPYHTVPLSLDVSFNALLKSICPECSIAVTNEPLPFTFDSRLQMLRAGNNMGFQLASNVGFSMCFVAAFYVIFYIRERVTKAKLLQFVSGVNIWTFWSTAFVWDVITFVFTVVVLMVTILVFQEDGWKTADDMRRLFVLLFCFVWCVLPFVYLFSMIFDIPSSGFIKTVMVGIFLGIALFYVVFSLESPILELEHVAEKMTWIFLVVPHFALTQGLSNLNVINSIIPYCQQACDALGPACPNLDFVCLFEPRCCDNDYFAWKAPGIGRHITYLVITGTILFVILFLKELHVLDGLFYRSRKMYSGPPPAETEDAVMDTDVMVEKNRINAMTNDEIKGTNLVTKGMTKYYGKHLAVNQLSLAVQSGECFGLLGINGAGKTSTFKMLIGDETISSGEAWISGVSLKENLKEIYKDIGYCPQFDALLDDLTGRETLRIFCMMRGIAPHKIDLLSLKLAKEFNFIKHIDKQVKEYSGGNKRKLSTALALIGSPSVVYLDEPTTGMDPGAKRHLWNVMSKYRSAGKSIVLTSHSMEECEALCTRLAIMVNGEFKCLGSTQHLKNKFSKGYLLIIQMSNRNTDASEESRHEVSRVKSFVLANLTGAVLKEEHQGRLAYYIPISDTKWSSMFDVMETGKSALAIESYSLSQTSLEQVFLTFTKYQREDARRLASA